jgi:uncharacterized glyoxalase superfamily protein PhnB
MKPVDLARKLRRNAALEPRALDRGKAVLMAAIQQEIESRRRPTVVPQLPYEDIRAALSFLERAFGFREVATSRMVSADGRILHSYVEVGNSMIGIGSQGAHGAVSPKTAGSASQYISVYIEDIDALYEALDLEGHRWRFLQWLREVPQR